MHILERIRQPLERKTIAEQPISPECRLAVCLYRLGRGDYYFTISQLTGLGVSTISEIVSEVTQAIIDFLWDECINNKFPQTQDDFKDKVINMEELWQFPYSWSAIDGCHIPIKCPPGGLEAKKEYHNFKNFYSVILMAMVDAQYRFIWGSCGYPGNSHDSIIFKSTELYTDIIENAAIQQIGHKVGSVRVPPLILGDSAFTMHPWLMKPYTNAVPDAKQRYFNYRLSRGRMVTECAFGQLKGRWRILLRKCECTPQQVAKATLACMVLHNICLDLGDTISKKLDVTLDPVTHERRDRAQVRDLLHMTKCRTIPDKHHHACKIRDALADKLWQEKLS